MKCHECGTINDKDAVYCGICGEVVLEGKKLCYCCKTAVEIDTEHCPKCNAFIKKGYIECRKCGKVNSNEFKYCTQCKAKNVQKDYIIVKRLGFFTLVISFLQVLGFAGTFIYRENYLYGSSINSGFGDYWFLVNVYDTLYYRTYVTVMVMSFIILLLVGVFFIFIFKGVKNNDFGILTMKDRRLIGVSYVMLCLSMFVYIIISSLLNMDGYRVFQDGEFFYSYSTNFVFIEYVALVSIVLIGIFLSNWGIVNLIKKIFK